MSLPLRLALVLVLAPALQELDFGALVERLDGVHPALAREAWSELAAHPEPAARAALADFAAAPPFARRRRAELLAEVGDAAAVPPVIELLADPDPDVRRALVDFLARPHLAGAELETRVAALAERAQADPDRDVRTGAARALAELDDPRALAALGELLDALPIDERVEALEALPETHSAEGLVRALAVGGFVLAGEPRTPDEVLAAVLPLHGRLLADLEGGAEDRADRAPLVLGLRHPSGAVRQAAAEAFDRLLARLRDVGETERALAVLEGLEEQGLDPRLVQYQRARLAFYPGADPEAAIAAARAIRERGRVDAPLRDEGVQAGYLWRFRSLHLEAMGELAAGRPDAAPALLEDAGRLLDGLLAERLDLTDRDDLKMRHAEALQLRALVDIALATARLAGGTRGDDAELLEGLRQAHTFTLEAQRVAADLGREALESWDALLDSDLSPYRLLFAGRELPGLSIERGLELQALLGRALASVSATEVPGFEPFEGVDESVAQPLRDPRRRELLRDIHAARLRATADDIEDLVERMGRLRSANPGILPVEEQSRLEELLLRQRMLSQAENRAGAGLLELRIPCSLALWLARDLRDQNRPVESRERAQAMRADLERVGLSRWWYYLGLERMAQIEMVIGSSWTDAGEPERAQEELEKAVARLEGIEERMRGLGASPRQLAPVRAVRCSALVSLAVNANVKLGDPERALDYYERAYELRQDDFMRVLLACYRARSGRAEEARALLRQVRPHAQLYYNMACTYALLGEREEALDMLVREFEEGSQGDASRQRQREWAREDPDLSSLHGDPRFETLVGER